MQDVAALRDHLRRCELCVDRSASTALVEGKRVSQSKHLFAEVFDFGSQLKSNSVLPCVELIEMPNLRLHSELANSKHALLDH